MKKINIKNIGVFSTTALFTAAVAYIYAPVFTSHADTVNIGAEIDAVIALSIDKDSLLLSGNPGNFVSDAITASVATNSAYGYTITMEDNDATTNLVSETSSDVFTSAFEGEKESSALDNNTWGYSINTTSFKAVPANGSAVTLKQNLNFLGAESEDTVITFGAKIGPSITSGLYQDQVILSAFTNGAPEPSIGDGTMQGFNAAGLHVGDSTDLIDTRNQKTYSVRKMSNGDVWMTKNLEIDGETLTPEDSDVATNFELASTSDTNAFYMDNQNAVMGSAENGDYYSWYAATAGTGTKSMSTNGDEAESSVCPKGWTLPTSAQASDLASNSEGFNPTLSGYMNGNSVNGSGSQLHYWTSTVESTYNAVTLFGYGSGENVTLMASSHTKNDGAPVRCVADSSSQGGGDNENPENDPRTSDGDMQSFACSNLGAGESAVLTDTRDNRKYGVKKLADGKCWMTENLRIIAKALDSEKSDLPSGVSFSIPTSSINGFSPYYESDYTTGHAYKDEEGDGTVYYNWYTATAGEGIKDMSTGDTSRSVCPKGWKLPSGGASGDYKNLVDSYTSPFGELYSDFNIINASGEVDEGTHSRTTTFFWTSSAYSSTYAYDATFGDRSHGETSSSVLPGDTHLKTRGFAVRCIAR